MVIQHGHWLFPGMKAAYSFMLSGILDSGDKLLHLYIDDE